MKRGYGNSLDRRQGKPEPWRCQRNWKEIDTKDSVEGKPTKYENCGGEGIEKSHIPDILRVGN